MAEASFRDLWPLGLLGWRSVVTDQLRILVCSTQVDCDARIMNVNTRLGYRLLVLFFVDRNLLLLSPLESLAQPRL